jgi:hypothetical protein
VALLLPRQERDAASQMLAHKVPRRENHLRRPRSGRGRREIRLSYGILTDRCHRTATGVPITVELGMCDRIMSAPPALT